MQLFISYAREDHKWAERLKAFLTPRPGVTTVWLDKDRLQAGVFYEDKIQRQISNSDYLIAIISAHSLSDGSYCRKEWQWAGDDGREILPLIIDGSSFPDRFATQHVEDCQRDGVEEAMRGIILRIHDDYEQRTNRWHETFSSRGADHADWQFSGWRVGEPGPREHFQGLHSSISGASNAKHVAHVPVRIGDRSKLTFQRKTRFMLANVLYSSAAFTVTVDDGVENIMDQVTASAGSPLSAEPWEPQEIDVSRFAGQSVILRLTLSLNDIVPASSASASVGEIIVR